ncbi:hypothetical protein KIN20_009882 [Parelaphostrongylus tenuis]|uniref:Uncharacterized protein n=1 Tax=Parelaphostrongylus tenuis TaxID=148309 RepID=A0AAD5M2C1_PARTN|nr:hypothetical protein KIN20_001159 [Parelaphostrongylus tenuis]KAJ1346386.1 hypothetical protein KIN20_001160 [Parelaphostrongylus tenuis]KAJ1349328.1 hypothetical protein KIN20_004827 [Parelaphostrongylus tenuis]KAJ1353282.1 hypothetical protein KIN20_009881 [Parelaphostrongylus tenuis]KAJ1353283.1 hypothetical protein KIN20_009882 [Parelaphostrongylus tenuis]
MFRLSQHSLCSTMLNNKIFGCCRIHIYIYVYTYILLVSCEDSNHNGRNIHQCAEMVCVVMLVFDALDSILFNRVLFASDGGSCGQIVAYQTGSLLRMSSML